MSKTLMELFKKYRRAVVAIETCDAEGTIAIGTGVHLGDGVIVTAAHVVKDMVTTTVFAQGDSSSLSASIRTENRQPWFFAEGSIDLAATRIEMLAGQTLGLSKGLPYIPLGGHLDDWINDDAFVLSEVLVMGFPPIPFSTEALLVTARGEINTVADLRGFAHPHFIISVMPRGGFSGGVVLSEWDFLLGFVTMSLMGDQAYELGHMSAVSVEPVYELLARNSILPSAQAEGWDGLWES